jgi:hypothetical protein
VGRTHPVRVVHANRLQPCGKQLTCVYMYRWVVFSCLDEIWVFYVQLNWKYCIASVCGWFVSTSAEVPSTPAVHNMIHRTTVATAMKLCISSVT